MKFAVLALSLALLPLAATATPSIEDKWKASLVEDNNDWAKTPHAILKIQDAAYLGEGQTATLIGKKGQPASYKWVSGRKPGVLIADYRGGKLTITQGSAVMADAVKQKSIPVDTDVDVAGYPTQVSAGVMGVRVLVYNQKRTDALNFTGVDYFLTIRRSV